LDWKENKVTICDGGGKYNSKNFNAFSENNGIVKQTTIPYTLKHNVGVVKKKNKTFVENVQCMLQHMELDH
jgi:hypothetical protein